jgi:prepilin-type N-terminal cleavage/methylation domain-containing protein
MARRQELVNERGFTLAELLVASAVLGLLMLGIFTVQRQGLGAYQVGAARVEVQQNARTALETFFGEIRTAQTVTPIPACGTGPVPTGGGATSISFTDQNGAAFQYQLVGTDLRRNGVVLIGGVQSLRIWCYDEAGGLTAVAATQDSVAPNQVATVHVQVSTRTESVVAATSDRNQHAFMETRVRLRNLPPTL